MAKIANILEMDNCRVKRSVICDSGGYLYALAVRGSCDMYMGSDTYNLLVFNIILGSCSALSAIV